MRHYKLKNKNREYDLIDINKNFSCSADFNKHINYKIYNILFNSIFTRIISDIIIAIIILPFLKYNEYCCI